MIGEHLLILAILMQPPPVDKGMTIADALVKLTDKDVRVRLQAVGLLRRHGTELSAKGIAALVGSLHDADPLVRQAAAASVGEIGPRAREWGGGPKVGEALVKLFQDKDPTIRKVAVKAYGEIGLDSAAELQPLMALSKNPSVELRGLALLSLSQYAHEEAPAEWRAQILDHLADALSDKDQRVQQLAARQLLSGGKESLPGLMRVVEKGVGTSRLWAAVVLGELGSAALEAVPILQKTVNEVPKEGRPYVQQALKKIQP